MRPVPSARKNAAGTKRRKMRVRFVGIGFDFASDWLKKRLCPYWLEHIAKKTSTAKVFTHRLVFPLQATAAAESVRKWPELFLLQTILIITKVIPRASGR